MKNSISTTALLGAATFASIAAPKGPNVLIIYTDEQNFRTIGAHRALLPEEAAEPWGKGNVVETPNLDYLANNGAICSNFYVATPVSSPSRSTFMSGMYTGDTHVVANDVHMNDNIETFAKTLMNNGYTTGYAGKWHLDGSEKPGWAPAAKFGFEDNRFMFNRGHFKKVPFIIHYPKAIKAGTVIRHPMGNPDFTPTILAMTGTKSSINYAGRDCSELIKTNKVAKDWDNVVFANMGSWIMATDGRYKLICSVKPDGYVKENVPVLFDLVEDPLEINNIYGQKGLEAETKSLQAHMDRYYTTQWAVSNGREKRVIWANSNTVKR